MKAGRELDALVAEHVIGAVVVNAPCGDGLTRTDEFHAPTMEEAAAQLRDAYASHTERGMRLWGARYTGPEYSTSIAAAWEVVGKTVERTRRTFKCGYSPNLRGELGWWVMFGDADATGSADTAPEAICLAALKACGVEVPDE